MGSFCVCPLPWTGTSCDKQLSCKLHDDYVVSYTAFSGILWLVCMSTFAFLGVLIAKLSADEALYRARVRRLLYLDSSEEVPTPPESVRSAARLQELINSGLLYKTDSHGYAIDEAAPLPTAGPFHVFLSHSAQRNDSSPPLPYECLLEAFPRPVADWKHAQEKMRIIKKALREMLPGVSVFLE